MKSYKLIAYLKTGLTLTIQDLDRDEGGYTVSAYRAAGKDGAEYWIPWEALLYIEIKPGEATQ